MSSLISIENLIRLKELGYPQEGVMRHGLHTNDSGEVVDVWVREADSDSLIYWLESEHNCLLSISHFRSGQLRWRVRVGVSEYCYSTLLECMVNLCIALFLVTKTK